jgi:hypothetical protein
MYDEDGEEDVFKIDIGDDDELDEPLDMPDDPDLLTDEDPDKDS